MPLRYQVKALKSKLAYAGDRFNGGDLPLAYASSVVSASNPPANTGGFMLSLAYAS